MIVHNLNLIKEFEALRLEAYIPTPGDVPTIGWGTTAGVRMGDSIDLKTAENFLRHDIMGCEDCVNSSVKVPLTQNQFDALVSLVYNIGRSAFASSTLVRRINAHDSGAAAEFMRWDKFRGVPLAGLTRRRQAEHDLYVS